MEKQVHARTGSGGSSERTSLPSDPSFMALRRMGWRSRRMTLVASGSSEPTHERATSIAAGITRSAARHEARKRSSESATIIRFRAEGSKPRSVQANSAERTCVGLHEVGPGVGREREQALVRRVRELRKRME